MSTQESAKEYRARIAKEKHEALIQAREHGEQQPLVILNDYYKQQRAEEIKAQQEQKKQAAAQNTLEAWESSWAHTLPLPPQDPLVQARKQKQINGE